MTTSVIEFGPFRLDMLRGELFRYDERVVLGWRAIAVLTALVERVDAPVSREELIRRAWPNSIVESNNLRVQISAIRKALGETNAGKQLIQNVPGFGYQFCPLGDAAAKLPAGTARRLPHISDVLLGRQHDLDIVCKNIAKHRMVTLCGIGGIGKTALALEAGRSLTKKYRDGVHYIDLASINQGQDIVSALHERFLSSRRKIPLLKDLIQFFQGCQILLIVDTCEHVAEDLTTLLDAFIANCPQLDVIATSRIPLDGNHPFVHRVEGLSCPPVNCFPFSTDHALSYPAAELFVRKAKAATPTFELSPWDGNALSEICTHLDGVPLAIELAALRTEGSDLRSLSIQLRKAAPVLSGRRTGNAALRQSTLADTLQWSFALLTQLEQIVLVQLSVFRSTFDEAGAMAALTVTGMSRKTCQTTLESLTEKSILIADNQANLRVFKIPRAFRAHLYTKLTQEEAFSEVLRRHAHYIHAQISQRMPGRTLVPREALPALYGTVEEIRAALEWCLDMHGDPVLGLSLLGASAYVWCHVSQFEAYAAIGLKALAETADIESASVVEGRMRLSIALGISIYSVQGASATMHELLKSGIALAEQRQDDVWKSLGLRGMWKYFHGLSEQTQALNYAQQTSRLARSAKIASSHATLKGISYLYAGGLKRAGQYLHCAMRISDPVMQRHVTTDQSDQRTIDMCMQARLLWLTGAFASAIDTAEACLVDAMAKGRPITVIATLALAVCPIYCWSGNLEMANQRLRMLEQYAALYEMPHWSRYAEVFRLGQGISKEDLPGVRMKTNINKWPWSQRHIEEFSVLRNGFVPPSLITVARSRHPIWCSAENLRHFAAKRHVRNPSEGRNYTVQVLNSALTIARKQGAVGWQLRTSLTLAGLLFEDDRIYEAISLVETALQQGKGKMVTSDQVGAREFVENMHLAKDRFMQI